MNIKKPAIAILFLCAFLGFSTKSFAITAGELLEEESLLVARYLYGLVDMLAYFQFVEGNDERGNCIYNWFYRTEGSIEKIHAYLEKYPEKPPEAIVIVLAKRPCPPPESEG